MFQNLPLELLTETIGYVHQPSHLQALCLVSKTMSSIATRFLYRNLVLDFPFLTTSHEKEADVHDAVLMSGGLRFVKTLKVGPMRGKMIALFDGLMSQFRDHSLVNFEWDPDEPPLDSQLRYIWDHQCNIQSIDLTKMANAVQTAQPCEGLRFPQKYVNLSLSLPLEEDLSKKLDLAYMTALTVMGEAGKRLPSCISANLIHITNLQLHHIHYSAEDLELDHFTSLVSLGLYCCAGSGSILSNFKNPKLKHFHIEFDWPDFENEMLDNDYEWMDDEEFEAQFSFIRSFEGLETLVIEMPDQRHLASLFQNLVDSISLDHNNTLRHLALLDSCKPKDAREYIWNTIEFRRSMYGAVMACPHLVQLELPTEWREKEMVFKQLTDNLPSLKFLCLRLHLAWDGCMVSHFVEKLPLMIAMEWAGEMSICQVASGLIHSITDKSSKLRLLTFEMRGRKRNCYTRGWSHSANLVSDGPCLIPEHLVKYHIPEYEPMPESARAMTWKNQCEYKRVVLEEWNEKLDKTS